MRSGIQVTHLLFALLVAAFVTFYPLLDAAGYCDGGGCPEVSHPAYGAGAGTAAVGGGISFVVGALVAVPFVLRDLVSRSAPPSWGDDVLSGIDLPPEVPPPQPSS